ncbi:MAG TPA: HipA family kinase [Ktedonobacterales bacterium]|nr:HipA family kinase [Ktedonobacterales bacterium]
MLRTVIATRYVEPLREGGSVPAIIEADDEGMYVVKFRGAGQGPKALVAELMGGEIGRALALTIPELVFVELDEAFGRAERDPELQGPLKASVGLNLALDYLPGSFMFDPLVAREIDPALASRVVWFDAFITNPDRTARNPNILSWHGKLWLIDHGASLYFHYAWDKAALRRWRPFPAIRDHVLLPWAKQLAEVDAPMRSLLSDEMLANIVAEVPAAWLADDSAIGSADEQRAAYLEYLAARRDASEQFVEEALHARAQLV